jgi:hypothetical protein
MVVYPTVTTTAATHTSIRPKQRLQFTAIDPIPARDFRG